MSGVSMNYIQYIRNRDETASAVEHVDVTDTLPVVSLPATNKQVSLVLHIMSSHALNNSSVQLNQMKNIDIKTSGPSVFN